MQNNYVETQDFASLINKKTVSGKGNGRKHKLIQSIYASEDDAAPAIGNQIFRKLAVMSADNAGNQRPLHLIVFDIITMDAQDAFTLRTGKFHIIIVLEYFHGFGSFQSDPLKADDAKDHIKCKRRINKLL